MSSIRFPSDDNNDDNRRKALSDSLAKVFGSIAKDASATSRLGDSGRKPLKVSVMTIDPDTGKLRPINDSDPEEVSRAAGEISKLLEGSDFEEEDVVKAGAIRLNEGDLDNPEFLDNLAKQLLSGKLDPNEPLLPLSLASGTYSEDGQELLDDVSAVFDDWVANSSKFSDEMFSVLLENQAKFLQATVKALDADTSIQEVVLLATLGSLAIGATYMTRYKPDSKTTEALGVVAKKHGVPDWVVKAAWARLTAMNFLSSILEGKAETELSQFMEKKYKAN